MGMAPVPYPYVNKLLGKFENLLTTERKKDIINSQYIYKY